MSNEKTEIFSLVEMRFLFCLLLIFHFSFFFRKEMSFPPPSPSFSPSYPEFLNDESMYQIPPAVVVRGAHSSKSVLVMFPDDGGRVFIFPLQEALADPDLGKLPPLLRRMFTCVENVNLDVDEIRRTSGGEGEGDVARILLLLGFLVKKGWLRDCEKDSFPSNRFLISATWVFRLGAEGAEGGGGLDEASLKQIYSFWEFEYCIRLETQLETQQMFAFDLDNDE